MLRSVFSLLILFVLQTALHAAAEDFIARIRDAEMAGNSEQVASSCREWYASGQFSSGLLDWNYNALMSLEPDALLVTQNDNDTYPVWMLQYALQVRPDVHVLNLDLLQNQAYRDQVVRRERLSFIHVGSSLSEFLQGCVSTKNVFPTYFGIMTDKSRLETTKNSLYLTGLALKYSARPFDNIAVLRNNYENRFRLDYLKLPMAYEADPAAIAQINLNYLPAFVLLYRHYSTAGETEKSVAMHDLILRIGQAGNKESEVRALLDKKNTAEQVVSDITPKMLEKGMKNIAGHLYAAETETTNAQYDRFLQDLLKNRDFQQLELCKTAKTDWRTFLPDSLKNRPDAVIFPHGRPEQPEMPVQNISHEAAERYCNWMTAVYNASTERKKFKKVVFRLPTEAEWMLAAAGGIQNAAYPWGGYYVRNSKGCYLVNMKVEEPCTGCTGKGGPDADGGFFPVAADSYFPNNYGLYNVSGNVSEMLQEAGKTKGGSWNDIHYYGQIKTVGEYSTPGPAVGFRVFMEVIEE
ncbi:MAG: SUMF1/EgtB/PvdO family nonheme iron enzyme [Saprospiraceae bacterium]|nr:SUMF1/EgtB/PvdO family nonheme iron enzyme [Saprospiraceae bacterium]